MDDLISQDLRSIEVILQKIDKKIDTLISKQTKSNPDIDKKINSISNNIDDIKNAINSSRGKSLSKITEARASVFKEVDEWFNRNNSYILQDKYYLIDYEIDVKDRLLYYRMIDSKPSLGKVYYPINFQYLIKYLKILYRKDKNTVFYWTPVSHSEFGFISINKVALHLKCFNEENDNNHEIRIIDQNGESMASVIQILNNSYRDKEIKLNEILCTYDRIYVSYDIREQAYDYEDNRVFRITLETFTEIYDHNLNQLKVIKFNFTNAKRYAIIENEFIIHTEDFIAVYDLDLNFKEKLGQSYDETRNFYINKYEFIHLSKDYVYMSLPDSNSIRIFSRKDGAIIKDSTVGDFFYLPGYVFDSKSKRFLYISIHNTDSKDSSRRFLIYNEMFELIEMREFKTDISSLHQLQDNSLIADLIIRGHLNGNRYIDFHVV